MLDSPTPKGTPSCPPREDPPLGAEGRHVFDMPSPLIFALLLALEMPETQVSAGRKT